MSDYLFPSFPCLFIPCLSCFIRVRYTVQLCSRQYYENCNAVTLNIQFTDGVTFFDFTPKLNVPEKC